MKDYIEKWNDPKTVTLTYGACHLLSGWVQEHINKLEHTNEVFKKFDEEFKEFHKENKMSTDSRKQLRKNIRYLKAIKKALS